MKKLLKKLFILGTISTMLVVNVSALEPSWNMAGGGYGEKEEYERFWPTNGEVSATFKSDYATTRIRFSYDSATVKQLAQYQKDDLYPGIDIKTISSGFDYDLFNAYSIITTLPNPVEDYENDDPLGSRDEEAEVTSLGGIAVFIWYILSGGGSYLESDPLQGFASEGIPFVDDQAARLGVGDDHRLGVSALPNDYVGGGSVHHIAVRRFDLRQHISAGGQVGDVDLA